MKKELKLNKKNEGEGPQNPQMKVETRGRKEIPYNKEIAEKICDYISSNTCSLNQACKNNKDFPQRETIHTWRIRYPDFAEMYLNAKKSQVEALVDEALEVAQDSSQDTVVDDNGVERANSEWIGRSRLKIDTYKWIACKLVPRLYGDKVTSDTTVTVKHEDAIKELE